ncbi:MAG: type IV secretory system conjugative DNA transfer family protein [Methylomicrobium sp.]
MDNDFLPHYIRRPTPPAPPAPHYIRTPPPPSRHIIPSSESLLPSFIRARMPPRGSRSIVDFDYTLFGSASFMTPQEAIDLNLNQAGNGRTACPAIGSLRKTNTSDPTFHLFARRPSSRTKVLAEVNGHILTDAPTRAGKGTSQIIPTLLTWQGSAFVIDIKGENYYRTAGCRAKKRGQQVYRFAPFEQTSHTLNPLMSIRANLDGNPTWKERCEEEEDTRYLVDLLITKSESVDSFFWENVIIPFLVGLLLHIRTAALLELKNVKDADKPEFKHHVRERSMREMRRLLTSDEDTFSSVLEDMAESSRKLVQEAGTNLKQCLASDGRLTQSILTTVIVQTQVWSYERLHGVTYKASENGEPAPNDFSFSQLRDGNTTIYLIIPPENLTEYQSVLRVMTGLALRESKDSYLVSKKKPEYQDNPPILFILDEFPQLGYMQPIEDALSYIAGYGVRFWFFIQDISQLKRHYQKSWTSFFSNTDIKCFFGVNDIETAKLVSEMIGVTTVRQHSESIGSSESHSNGYAEGFLTNQNETFSSNTSRTGSFAPARLMTADEVLRMRENEQIVFINGTKPIFCYLAKYYESPDLEADSKILPPEEIDFH